MSRSSAPFVRLSPDILFIIARFAYPDVQDDLSFKEYFSRFTTPIVGNDSHPKESVVDLTRVCRHWRYAFLSCPSFWTKVQIPERSVWYLEEILLRSADYPLKVTVNYYPKYSSQTMARHSNILSAHLRRIQSLVIHQRHEFNKVLPDYISYLINNPAPMLEVFHFDFTTPTHLNRLASDTPRTIPETLFADHAPNLKEIRISLMKLSYDLPILIFRTITRLCFVFVHGLTHDRLLDIMEAVSSNLEALQLISPTNFPWTSQTKDVTDRSVIPLPSLRTLWFSVDLETLLVIVCHTDIPFDVEWNIDCGDLLSEVALDISPILSFLAKLRKDNNIILSIYDNIHIEFGQTHSGVHNTSLDFLMDRFSNEECLERLEAILSNMDLSNVKSCELKLTCHARPFWVRAYEQRLNQHLLVLLNQMEKLSISCQDIELLLVFVNYLRPQTTEAITKLPCPLLRDLKIGLVTTMDGTSGLIETLVARREAGNTLTNLCIEYENNLDTYSITLELNPLTELVGNVEMIGKTPSSPDDSESNFD